MNVLLDSPAAAAQELLDQVPVWFEDWEQAFSRFRPDSELTHLNQQAGHPVPVSAALWEVLRRANEAVQWSAGLVTPTVLPALESAGYDRSFELIDGADTPARAAVAGPWEAIHWDAARMTVTLPTGMALDLGGLAKGWAADTAAQRLREAGPAMVDAGGDIAVSGPRLDGQPWPIGLGDPFRPEQVLEILRLNGGGVATSGRDYRRWQKNGQWQHHLIDPRTGRSAATDVMTATVMAPSAREAEIAAKTAFILGCDAGLDWLDAQPSVAGWLITEDGAMHYSLRSDAHLWTQPAA